MCILAALQLTYQQGEWLALHFACASVGMVKTGCLLTRQMATAISRCTVNAVFSNCCSFW